MKIKTTMAVLLGCAWLTLAQSPDPVREALERGLAAEESTRDLAGAAKAYTDAVTAADARRATHATALFRLAEVQRRQGKTNEATELYRRVLAEFPDQAEMVAVARRHVGEARPAAGGSGNSLALQRLGMRHQDLLQAERDLSLATDRLNHYLNLNEDQRLQWLAREVPTSRARMLLEKIATSQQELETLTAKVGTNHPDRQAAESLLKAIEEQVFQETHSAEEALHSEMTFHKGRLAGLADQVRQLEKEAAVSPGMPGVIATGLAAGPMSEAEQLLEDEIRVAEQQLVVEQRKFEAGRGETEEVLKAQRDVLNLKRQLAEKRQRRDLLDVSPSVGDSKAETPETSPPALDEEEKEIVRLQGLYRNSPDLLNNPGPNGTPLEQAASDGKTRILAYLLGDGMPTRSAGALQVGLRSAVAAGRLDTCRMLLDAGADPNELDRGGGLPLLRAAYAGHRAIVELLLDRGAQLDGSLPEPTRNLLPGAFVPQGANAIGMAAYGKRLAVMDLLLQRGANPNAMDAAGTTALGSTLFGSRTWDEGSYRLLEAGADPDIGYALHIACNFRPTMVRALLDAGADPNRVVEESYDSPMPPKYNTPLHLIVASKQSGALEAMKLLLDAGAYVNAGDANGQTPLDRATSPEIRALLIAKGGRSVIYPQPGLGLVMINGALAHHILRNVGTELPPLRLAQILQSLLQAETNATGFSPDLSKVVVTARTDLARRHGLPRAISMTVNPATGQVEQQESEPLLITTNDVLAILASGDPAKDVEIQTNAYTQIYVPFKAREKSVKPTRRSTSMVAPKGAGLVTVLGEVQRPGNIEMGPGKPMDLVQVIAASGGLTKNADRRRIVLRRGPDMKALNLDTAMTNRITLEPGDIIEVKERTF